MNRSLALLLWILGAALAAADPALACRCEQRSLAQYFDTADEVFIARLATAHLDGSQHRFEFEPEISRLKSVLGAQRPYLSAVSSAACGVAVEPGATYLVFAQHDSQRDVARLSTCNGTRIHRTVDGEVRGFDDTPGRFVVAQLDALAALDVLRGVAEAEPNPDDPDNGRLIGLLDLPKLSSEAPASLFDGPDGSAAVVATVRSIEDLEHRENGYEVDAAVVFAIAEDGWFRLQTNQGIHGWYRATDASAWHPYDTLPIRRLTYLNRHWDGFVWPNVGAGQPRRRPTYDDVTETRAEFPVRVLESQRLGGSLWFRIELLAASPCSGGEPRVTLGGWIPAYGRSGEPAVWFYSRGC